MLSMLEVMSTVETMEEMQSHQVFEPIVDPLMALGVPIVTKIIVKVTKVRFSLLHLSIMGCYNLTESEIAGGYHHGCSLCVG